jgi:hypothetical protein
MDFVQYVNSLPNLKVEEIRRIAEVTSSSPASVYRWLSGGELPEIKKKAIADYYGKPIEELFPPKK